MANRREEDDNPYELDDMIPCVHCKYKENRRLIRAVRENLASDDVTVCLACRQCVCNVCYASRYTGDARYEEYEDAAGYDEFVCQICIESAVNQ